jgi:hypothetical protein
MIKITLLSKHSPDKLRPLKRSDILSGALLSVIQPGEA